MKIGMWIIRSLLWPGVLKVLHNELSKLDFDVVALQETQLESGIQKFDYVKDFKIINERICCLRLKAKWFFCTLINVHAPTNEKTEEVKE